MPVKNSAAAPLGKQDREIGATDLAVLTDRELHARLEGLGVTLIGYRALRDAQRAAG